MTTATSSTPPPDEAVPPWAGARHTKCTGCGVTDNHPKKTVVFDFSDASKDQEWHHDCHFYKTGDLHSGAVVEQSGGAQGHALRVFLHGDPDAGTAGQFTHPDHATAHNLASPIEAPSEAQGEG